MVVKRNVPARVFRRLLFMLFTTSGAAAMADHRLIPLWVEITAPRAGMVDGETVVPLEARVSDRGCLLLSFRSMAPMCTRHTACATLRALRSRSKQAKLVRLGARAVLVTASAFKAA